MGHSDLDRLNECGVIAIVRLKRADELLNVAHAIREADVDVIEFAMTTPGALDVIRDACLEFGDDVLLGAGTVLDPETARAAILAGARFIVSPLLQAETIHMCKRYGVLSIPGALTPTEIETAWEHGADFVKVFPATLGGPQYIRDVLAPLPHLKLVPTGGVDLTNAEAFIRSGAAAIAVGSSLVDPDLVTAREFDRITASARALKQAVALGRAQAVDRRSNGPTQMEERL